MICSFKNLSSRKTYLRRCVVNVCVFIFSAKRRGEPEGPVVVNPQTTHINPNLRHRRRRFPLVPLQRPENLRWRNHHLQGTETQNVALQMSHHHWRVIRVLLLFLLLLKEEDTHLSELEARDKIPIAMEDISTSHVGNMRFRFWPNNKSYMHLLENASTSI